MDLPSQWPPPPVTRTRNSFCRFFSLSMSLFLKNRFMRLSYRMYVQNLSTIVFMAGGPPRRSQRLWVQDIIINLITIFLQVEPYQLISLLPAFAPSSPHPASPRSPTPKPQHPRNPQPPPQKTKLPLQKKSQKYPQQMPHIIGVIAIITIHLFNIDHFRGLAVRSIMIITVPVADYLGLLLVVLRLIVLGLIVLLELLGLVVLLVVLGLGLLLRVLLVLLGLLSVLWQVTDCLPVVLVLGSITLIHCSLMPIKRPHLRLSLSSITLPTITLPSIALVNPTLVNPTLPNTPAPEIEIIRHISGPTGNLIKHQSPRIIKIPLPKIIRLGSKLRRDIGMLIDGHPDILDHLLFLSAFHAFVEVLGVCCGHQDYSVAVEMVCCEVWAVPDLCLSDLVETDVVVCDLEGAESVMQLMEAGKGLAHHIECLAMVQILNIRQPMRHILTMHNNILSRPTGASLPLRILRIIDLNNRLVGQVPVMVNFHLIILRDGRVVRDHVFFCSDP